MDRNNVLLIQILTNCNFLTTKAVSLKAKHTLELTNVDLDTTYLSTLIEANIFVKILVPKTAGRQCEGLNVNLHKE